MYRSVTALIQNLTSSVSNLLWKAKRGLAVGFQVIIVCYSISNPLLVPPLVFFLVRSQWLLLSAFFIHCSPTLYWSLVLITLSFNTLRLSFFLMPDSQEKWRAIVGQNGRGITTWGLTPSQAAASSAAFCKPLNLSSGAVFSKSRM